MDFKKMILYGDAGHNNEVYEPQLDGWLTGVTTGLQQAGSLLTTYYQQQAQVEAAKAQVQANIAAGQAAAGAGTAGSNLDQYMPIILGIGGLMAIAVLLSATKK